MGRLLHPSIRVDHNLCRELCCTPLPINRQTRDGLATWSNNRAVQETPELLHCPSSDSTPDLKDWSNFSRGKTGRPKMDVVGLLERELREERRSHKKATCHWQASEGRVGQEGTLPRVLKTYHVKLWNKLCVYIFESLVIPIVFPV